MAREREGEKRAGGERRERMNKYLRKEGVLRLVTEKKNELLEFKFLSKFLIFVVYMCICVGVYL